ncbi:MAG: YigZ family protein [bacterium]|nr:YigZ family protein [bacterium]
MSSPPGSYRVLREPCSGELREKGSRFLALLEPVLDSEAAVAYRREVAGRYRDASHHCWAQRIGWPAEEHSSDAGEPSGTAGEPIARVLRFHELSDITAIVVRWFGGVKLGKGGLARAYAGAVAAALESARFEERFPTTRLRVRMAYDRIGAVKRLARVHGAKWTVESYGADVEVTLGVRTQLEEVVRAALADLRVEVLPARRGSGEAEDDS